MAYSAPLGNAVAFVPDAYYEPARVTHAFNTPTDNYTASSGDALNFVGTWVAAYVAPLGASVVFTNQLYTPTATFAGSTALAFFGKVDKTASYAVSTSTSVDFQHWYRDFAIPTSSSITFVTDLRDLHISTGSTPVFRHGSSATIPTSTTLAPNVLATLPIAIEINCSSVVAPQWISTARTKFTSSGLALFTPAKRDNQPTRMVVRTNSKMVPTQSSVVKSTLGVAANTLASFKTKSIVGATFAFAPTTLVRAQTARAIPATGTANSVTSVAFSGLNVHARSGTVVSNTVANFHSSYTTGYVAPELHELDSLHVVSRPKQLFVTATQ